MLLIVYSYTFILVLSLIAIIAALKYPVPLAKNAIKSNPFDMVSITHGEEGAKKEMGVWSAILSAILLIGFLVLGLFLMIKIPNAMRYMMLFSISLMVAKTIGTLLSKLCGGTLPRKRSRIDWILFIPSLAVGTSWIYAPSWLTIDVCAVVVAYSALSYTTSLKITRLAIGLLGILLFDVWGVFHSKMIVEVAISALTDHPLPILIMVPKIPLAWSMEFMGVLGLGDIIFTGLACITAAKYKLEWWTLAAFPIGLGICQVLAFVVGGGFPAMLVLSPLLLLFLLVGARFKKVKLEW